MTDAVRSVRATAAVTVDRVMRTGAYSNIVVHETDLTGPDRARHQVLVFETLRWLQPIDDLINMASSRPIERMDPLVRSVLRVAATEIIRLDHAHHGVVDGAVAASRELGQGRSSGFVNAVARRISEHSAGSRRLRTEQSVPSWMLERVLRAGATPQRIFGALNQPAPVGIRVRPSGTAPEGFVAVDGIAGAYVASPGVELDTPDPVLIDVVDPATTAVAAAVAARPGDVVADVAAAPGGKTSAIADAVGLHGTVVASDIHRGRVQRARRRLRPTANVDWILADARRPPFAPNSFDRVLLDAPCTGLGTLRRRPELRHRIDDRAPERYGRLQCELVAACLPLVKPGGRLVYSVCTLFPEETVDVVDRFGGRTPTSVPGADLGVGRMMRPDLAGTDGMFVSVIDC
ncbi:MAG: methyltransferase domain-containing protein [Acidimicrobiia bacterium]|nr:methyltransferase domain-containing protein [Acidimicrobiia bacterium]